MEQRTKELFAVRFSVILIYCNWIYIIYLYSHLKHTHWIKWSKCGRRVLSFSCSCLIYCCSVVLFSMEHSITLPPKKENLEFCWSFLLQFTKCCSHATFFDRNRKKNTEQTPPKKTTQICFIHRSLKQSLRHVSLQCKIYYFNIFTITPTN